MKEHIVVPVNEITFAMIKPDAVKAGHAGEIISIMERHFEIGDVQYVTFEKGAFARFYEEHEKKPFFLDLCSFMSSGPVFAITLIGEKAVARWRNLMGPTDPKVAGSAHIRGMFGSKDGPMMHNAVHGSDSMESALREIDWAKKYGEQSFGYGAEQLVAGPVIRVAE